MTHEPTPEVPMNDAPEFYWTLLTVDRKRWGCIVGECAFILLMLAGLYGILVLYADLWHSRVIFETGATEYRYPIGEQLGYGALLALTAAMVRVAHYLRIELRA